MKAPSEGQALADLHAHKSRIYSKPNVTEFKLTLMERSANRAWRGKRTWLKTCAAVLAIFALSGCGEMAARGLLARNANAPLSSSGALWIYSPPVGKGDTGRIIQLTPMDGKSASIKPARHAGNSCPTDAAGFPPGEADALACVIAVASSSNTDGGSLLRAFLVKSPQVTLTDSSCGVLKQIFAEVVDEGLGCDRLRGAFSVHRSRIAPGLPTLAELLERPGFLLSRVKPPTSMTEGKLRLRLPGDIFDVQSAIFRRPGFAGRINYSPNTGVPIDADIIFWGGVRNAAQSTSTGSAGSSEGRVR